MSISYEKIEPRFLKLQNLFDKEKILTEIITGEKELTLDTSVIIKIMISPRRKRKNEKTKKK